MLSASCYDFTAVRGAGFHLVDETEKENESVGETLKHGLGQTYPEWRQLLPDT